MIYKLMNVDQHKPLRMGARAALEEGAGSPAKVKVDIDSRQCCSG